MVDQIVQVGEARLNITWAGSNGELRDTINYGASDVDIKRWATEAVRAGSVPGIPADPNVDFTDFVVDRFGPNETRPYSICMIRGKTPFG
jgi:hypothetical protein